MSKDKIELILFLVSWGIPFIYFIIRDGKEAWSSRDTTPARRYTPAYLATFISIVFCGMVIYILLYAVFLFSGILKP